MADLERLSINEFKETEKAPVVLVLDNIRSMLNIGSAFRTADAFKVAKIFLCGITATPPHREINKTALGATESVEWEHYPSVADAVIQLQADGYQIGVIEQIDKSVMLDKCDFSEGKHAFVFGNEAMGVSSEVLEIDGIKAIEIPQFGTKHSLNVSVSIGVILWHYTLQNIKK